MKRASTARVPNGLLGLAPALLLSFVRTARAQQGGPEEELTQALENTSERIDFVGHKLAQLGDRTLDLLPLLAVALVTVVVFSMIAHLLTRGETPLPTCALMNKWSPSGRPKVRTCSTRRHLESELPEVKG